MKKLFLIGTLVVINAYISSEEPSHKTAQEENTKKAQAAVQKIDVGADELKNALFEEASEEELQKMHLLEQEMMQRIDKTTTQKKLEITQAGEEVTKNKVKELDKECERQKESVHKECEKVRKEIEKKYQKKSQEYNSGSIGVWYKDSRFYWGFGAGAVAAVLVFPAVFNKQLRRGKYYR